MSGIMNSKGSSSSPLVVLHNSNSDMKLLGLKMNTRTAVNNMPNPKQDRFLWEV